MRHVLPRGALEDPADSTLDAMEANTYYVTYGVDYLRTVLYKVLYSVR